MELLGELLETQFWTIARRQLLAEGIGRHRIESWRRSSRLHDIYPGVYAWGRADLSVEGELAAGLLYAGDGAALGGLTMLWWRGLLGRRPDRTHIDAPGYVASYADLTICHPSRIRRSLHRGLPLVAPEDALLRAAPQLSPNALRLVIARTEYHRLCTLDAIEASLGPGRQGSRAVRHALSRHLPQLAQCVNRWERAFVLLCEAGRVEIPEPNPRIGRYRPDMLWRDAKLIVELDGPQAHSTPAQLLADAERQRFLESLGYRVLRFSHEEVEREPGRVLAMVRAALRPN